MKTQAMTSGLRVTLSKTELEALLTLARYGAEQLAGIAPVEAGGSQGETRSAKA